MPEDRRERPAAQAEPWRPLADAVSVVARAERPEAWPRYCAIAAAHDPGAASAEAAGLRRLRQPRGTKNLEAWGSPALAAAAALELELAAALVAALAAGRWQAAATSARDGRWRELEAGVWAVAGIALDPEAGTAARVLSPRRGQP